MTPQNGGKYELRLGSSNGDSAEYEVKLLHAADSFSCTARVGVGAGPKQLELGSWQGEIGAPAAPPAWLVDDARAALKAAFRSSQAEGRWPRRLARWRPQPSA